MTYRCFYCDRVTGNPANVTVRPNGLLSCAECSDHDRKAGK